MCRALPLARPVPRSPNPAILHLWQLRAAANDTKVQRNRVFRAWQAVARHWAAAKQAKKTCQEQKRRQVLGLPEQAEHAADAGDQRTVYQVVKKLAPWKPRQRVLIKDKDGLHLRNMLRWSPTARTSSPRNNSSRIDQARPQTWYLR